jgi:hypothetical protein
MNVQALHKLLGKQIDEIAMCLSALRQHSLGFKLVLV